MFLDELLKLRLYDDGKIANSKLCTEEALWLFRNTATSRERQGPENLILITSELLGRQTDV